MIYKLGQHIIAQGDSADSEFVSRVTKGIEIRSVIADPPYGVAYVENKNWIGLRGPSMEKSTKERKKIAGDQLQTDDEYAKFTELWIKTLVPHLAPKNSFYIFNSDVMACALRSGMKQADVYCSQFIIWVKNSIVLGRKDYNPQHELIAYGWHGTHKFERSSAKSVLFCPKPAKAKLHPTMKPVALLRKLIANSTKAGEWVCDPFLGSGSTLIACEHLKRRCLGIELDGGYVKTAIARWEKLTRLKAVLMEPTEKQATTMSHTGRFRVGQGIATPPATRTKKGGKI